MVGKRPSPEQSDFEPWNRVAQYAVLSLCSFLCGLLIIGLLLWNVDKLVSLGLVGHFYYFALLPLGLSVSAFLFGALRSYARYRGRQLGGVLELGGPVVGFVIVLILGFWLLSPPSNFPVTLYVHGAGGTQNLVIRGTGTIMLDTGGVRRKALIGSDGEAFFPEIPANFHNKEVPLSLDANGFELVENKARLSRSSVYIEVRKMPGMIRGWVQDEKTQKPLVGVSIFLEGSATSSKEGGRFELVVPANLLQPSMTLMADSPGFAPWKDTVVANSNDVTIMMRRER
jgi:hypothetical protein